MSEEHVEISPQTATLPEPQESLPSAKQSFWQRVRFPSAVYIILIYELLERFSFYGMKGLLTLYMKDFLRFTPDNAKLTYHLFAGFSYLLPVAGAIVADSYLGHYNTVMIGGLVYLAGHILMPLTALKRNVPGPLTAMLVLAVGTGLLKPCVAAFGGNQVDDPAKVDLFFSVFYACVNIGAAMSTIITPILKERVKCVENRCYPLAFGVAAVSFFVGYVVFVSFKKKYRHSELQKSVIPRLAKCFFHSIIRWWKMEKSERKERLFDHADEEKYSRTFLDDANQTMNVLVLFLPFPLYFALFDQTGSTWTLQASQMDGSFGSSGFTLYPDQLQTLNPIFVVVCIPLFQFVIYPLGERFHFLTRPTSRIIAGYVILGLSSIMSGVMQLTIDGTQHRVQSDYVDVSWVNTDPQCPVSMNFMGAYQVSHNLPPLSSKNPMDSWKRGIQTSKLASTKLALTFNGPNSSSCPFPPGTSQSVRLIDHIPKEGGKLFTAALYYSHQHSVFSLHVNKSSPVVLSGFGTKATVKVMVLPTNTANIKLENLEFKREKVRYNFRLGSSTSENQEMEMGKYEVTAHFSKPQSKKVQTKMVVKISSRTSAVIIVNVTLSASGEPQLTGMWLVAELHFKLRHMLWQMIQYFLLTSSEILFSVTALGFAYSEAPDSMKAFLQAANLITIFCGNMLVTIVLALPRIPSQAGEMFMYGGLTFIGGVLNWVLVVRYKKMKKLREAKQGEPKVAEEPPTGLNTTEGGAVEASVLDNQENPTVQPT